MPIVGFRSLSFRRLAHVLPPNARIFGEPCGNRILRIARRTLEGDSRPARSVYLRAWATQTRRAAHSANGGAPRTGVADWGSANQLTHAIAITSRQREGRSFIPYQIAASAQVDPTGTRRGQKPFGARHGTGQRGVVSVPRVQLGGGKSGT